jgi:hypothetical protein
MPHLGSSPGLAAHMGGICRPRFTAPKYLGFMVGMETKGWIAPIS